MNNSEMPAMPLGLVVTESGDMYGGDASEMGLTKREHFAGLAMQGLCHAIDSQGTWAHDAATVAEAAVRYAVALLAELDRS